MKLTSTRSRVVLGVLGLTAICLLASIVYVVTYWRESVSLRPAGPPDYWRAGQSEYIEAAIERKTAPLRRTRVTSAVAQEGWREVLAMMRAAKAPQDEVDGVVRAVRAHISNRRISNRRIFAMPVYAARNRAGDKSVWVFGYGWGLLDIGNGRIEVPDHTCTLVIDARPPYRILNEMSCP